MLKMTRWRLCGVGARPITLPPRLPQILFTNDNFRRVKPLVSSYVKDKSDMTRIRALSALASLARNIADPTEAELVLAVYRTLDAEDSAPEEVKSKLITAETNESFVEIDRSLAVLVSLKARATASAASPRSKSEIGARSEDALYELAQSVPSMDEIELSKFMEQFLYVCDCLAFDERAVYTCVNSIKERCLTDASVSPHNIVRLCWILQKINDLDTTFATAFIPVLNETIPKVDYKGALRILGFAANCEGFEDYELFQNLLSRMSECLPQTTQVNLAGSYSLISKIGIRHETLMEGLANRVRQRGTLVRVSLEHISVMIECVYAIGGQVDTVLVSLLMDAVVRILMAKEPIEVAYLAFSRITWSLSHIGPEMPGHQDFALAIGRTMLKQLGKKARVDVSGMDIVNAACWPYRNVL